MTPEHQTKLLTNEPRGLSMSRQLRIAIRSFVVVATIGAFVCFIFKPELAHLVTFPIPVSILAFGILAGFERILRCFSEWRYRRRFGLKKSREFHQKSSKLMTAFKLLAALTLGSLMIAADVFGFPILGGVAAVALLATALTEHPIFGCFATKCKFDSKARLRRQTLYAISSAEFETPCELRKPSDSDDDQGEDLENALDNNLKYHLVVDPEQDFEDDEVHEPKHYAASPRRRISGRRARTG